MNQHIIHTSLTLVFIGLSFATALSTIQPKQTVKSVKHESPFACNVNALSPAERKRHFDELGPELRSLKKAVRELKDGYEFRFDSDRQTFELVSEWAIQESACCPFFEIQLRLESEGGPLWLKLTGRNGTKEFIEADAAPWIKQ